jgi:hypothetical protein
MFNQMDFCRFFRKPTESEGIDFLVSTSFLNTGPGRVGRRIVAKNMIPSKTEQKRASGNRRDEASSSMKQFAQIQNAS